MTYTFYFIEKLLRIIIRLPNSPELFRVRKHRDSIILRKIIEDK